MTVFFFYQLDAQILYFNTFITFNAMFELLQHKERTSQTAR